MLTLNDEEIIVQKGLHWGFVASLLLSELGLDCFREEIPWLVKSPLCPFFGSVE